MSDVAGALESWRQVRGQFREFLLRSPEGHAIHHTANDVIRLLAAEITELRAANDAMVPGREVIHSMERDAVEAMVQARHCPEGTILRATDTLKQWVLRDGHWEEERP